jgi:hypothetical protein
MTSSPQLRRQIRRAIEEDRFSPLRASTAPLGARKARPGSGGGAAIDSYNPKGPPSGLLRQPTHSVIAWPADTLDCRRRSAPLQSDVDEIQVEIREP